MNKHYKKFKCNAHYKLRDFEKLTTFKHVTGEEKTATCDDDFR